MTDIIDRLQRRIEGNLRDIDAWRKSAVESQPGEAGLGLTKRNPGASPSDIQALSDLVTKLTAHSLPDELVALLLLHDGEPDDTFVVSTFPLGLGVMSVEDIRNAWQRDIGIAANMDRPDADDALDHDRRLRYGASPPSPTSIPFAGAPGLGYHLYVDLAPGPEGRLAQVIYNASEIDMEVLAPSLPDFLERYAAALAEGRFDLDGEFISTRGQSMADALAKA